MLVLLLFIFVKFGVLCTRRVQFNLRVCVCVCVCEREKETNGREKEREKETKNLYQHFL